LDDSVVATCWLVIAPLAAKASKILAQGSRYKRRIDRLSDLRDRAKAILRGYPNEDGEPHWAVFRKADELVARAAPPGYQDVMGLLKHLRIVQLSQSTVDRLERQIDFRLPGTICQTILRGKEELISHAGPSPADLPALDDGAPLVSEAEIDSLEAQVLWMEELQRGIDDAIREKSEAEQALAKRYAEDQNLSVIELALKLQSEGVSRQALKPRVMARMRFERRKTTQQDLEKWWLDIVSRALRRHAQKNLTKT
jgi:hypothetical protein